MGMPLQVRLELEASGVVSYDELILPDETHAYIPQLEYSKDRELSIISGRKEARLT